MVGQGTIVATGSIGYPVGLRNIGDMIGAEKVMTMTSTYDHRIIQGAESGRFLQLVEAYLDGENGFYDGVFAVARRRARPDPGAARPAAAAAAAARGAAAAPPASPDEAMLQAVQAATSLIKAHRTHGHLAARLDPLGSEPEGDPALDPNTVGLTPEIMARIPAKILRMYVRGATLADALPHLRETYCGTIAYEIEHISSHRQRVWLREKIESGEFRKPLTTDEQRALLQRLVEVDALERFMHKAYLGQKQFSIEGLDTTVPMLDEMIQLAAAARRARGGRRHGPPRPAQRARPQPRPSVRDDLRRVRGRLDARGRHVAAAGRHRRRQVPPRRAGHLPAARTATRSSSTSSATRRTSSTCTRSCSARRRAAQTGRQGPHARRDTNAAVPLVLHGDAAFPGQGVVAESLNLQAIDGYKVGGTLHLIQNNQVGFTTDPEDSRSTRWASDLAKGYDTPIIHVNADDVAGCISAVRLAFAFRQEFGHDVVIDLIGYRRFGHNEADEPAYTQPEMYAKIKNKKRVTRALGREARRVRRRHAGGGRAPAPGGLGPPHAAAPDAQGADQGGRGRRHRRARDRRVPARPLAVAGGGDRGARRASCGRSTRSSSPSPRASPSTRSSSSSSSAAARRWAARAGSTGPTPRRSPSPRCSPRACRSASPARTPSAGRSPSATWSSTTRRPGRRCRRSRTSPAAQAPFELHNSPLSEVACLGFEYGYSQEAPETLVLWEAQFGDFVNSAQVIVDQFIVSGLAKWGQTSRLTLLLPHGYEGSGPEHSSARLERFLHARRRGQPPRREPHDAGAVLPPAPPPGEGRQAAAARDHDAEVAAAPAAGDEPDRAPRRRPASSRSSASRACRSRRSRAWSSAPARSTTTSSGHPSRAGQRGRRRRPGRAALPLPRVADPRS